MPARQATVSTTVHVNVYFIYRLQSWPLCNLSGNEF